VNLLQGLLVVMLILMMAGIRLVLMVMPGMNHPGNPWASAADYTARPFLPPCPVGNSAGNASPETALSTYYGNALVTHAGNNASSN